jgi:tetratricopeptide (TPR) repeat protein
MIPYAHEPSGANEYGGASEQLHADSAVCEALQADLSSLIDGELDDRAAVRAIAHLEACEGCREFFDHIRAHVNLHQDLSDSDTLLGRFALLTGADDGAPRDLESRLLVHRLATILYQIGKAYALSVLDDAWRQRVFEPAVHIERARVMGRGFIDGVAADRSRGEERGPGVDWAAKRHLLNGTLERIPTREEKARRLLEECLAVEHDHEPAHIYLALLDARDGKVLRASRRLEEVFHTAVDPMNRGHAASQMGRMLFGEGDYRGALVWFRWIRASGLADEDARFAVVRFNIGLCYAHMGERQRALDAFRDMLDHHPDRAGELADIFRGSPLLRAAIDRQPGFTMALARTCPELFVAPVAAEPTNEDA